ncbi:MAG: CvpA family protein [Betaproteobacteria bacterium]
MTALDVAALAVVALSILLAYARGIIRSLVGTAAWIAGFVFALAFTPAVGAMLPDMPNTPYIPYVIAFVGIFVAALVVGALFAWPLRAIVRKAGMGFLDASLGATFGLVRGIALMVAFALVAGVTGIAQRDWWQNAYLAPSLASAAMALRPWLPHAWAERLDFSPTGLAPGAPARPEKA